MPYSPRTEKPHKPQPGGVNPPVAFPTRTPATSPPPHSNTRAPVTLNKSMEKLISPAMRNEMGEGGRDAKNTQETHSERSKTQTSYAHGNACA